MKTVIALFSYSFFLYIMVQVDNGYSLFRYFLEDF